MRIRGCLGRLSRDRGYQRGVLVRRQDVLVGIRAAMRIRPATDEQRLQELASLVREQRYHPPARAIAERMLDDLRG